jgi:hypothetical protein
VYRTTPSTESKWREICLEDSDKTAGEFEVQKTNIPVHLWNEFLFKTFHFSEAIQTTTEFPCKRQAGLATDFLLLPWILR